MKTSTFRATARAWDGLCRHLHKDDCREHLAFLPVGIRDHGDQLDLLALDVWPVPDDQLVGGADAMHVEPSPDALISVVNRAVRLGVGLVEAHNHPLCAEPVRFSRMDERGFDEIVPYMLESLRQPFYGAIVLGSETNVEGTVWANRPNQRRAITRWEATGFVRRDGITTSGSDQSVGLISADSPVMVDRQVRAFGREGQHRLAALCVAVVGVGGLGSVAVQQMAHLGIRRFALIDPDVVETTNLNRLVGATLEDVRQRSPKVMVAARLIRSLHPNAEIMPIHRSVFHPEAIAAVATADLVLCGTHDAASRYAVNEVSLAYVRPYLDLGTEIDGRDGIIQSIGGRFTFLFPGSGCLLCARAIDPLEAAAQLRPPQALQHDLNRGYVRGSTEPAPSVLPLNATVVSLAMNEVLAWSTGWRPPRTQKLYDGTDGSVCDMLFERDPNCMACAELLGRGDLARIAQRYAAWSG